MNFLGIGPGELFLIMLLALIVFGPSKLPEIGAGLGKAIGEFRRATNDITREITRELQVETALQEPRRTTPAPEEPSIATPAAQESPQPVLPAEGPRVAVRDAGGTPSLPSQPVEASVSTPPVEEPAVAPQPAQDHHPVPDGEEPQRMPDPAAAPGSEPETAGTAQGVEVPESKGV